MPIQRHLVVTPTDAGGVEIHPLKKWWGQHPDQIPADLNPNPTKSTSHQLRSALLKWGWSKQETPTEYRLFAPGIDAEVDIEEIIGTPGEDADNEGESPYFSLEYQLRDFIAANLGTVDIGGRHLRLFVDQTGRDGIEYPSAVGRIDILAVDDEGNFFVFELKRANSPDRALGQVARYMGWVKQTIGSNSKVYGVIIAKTISEKLKYAKMVVPDVYLFEYQISFSLNQAHDLSVRSFYSD